jgi:ribosomal-protein-alanine N-acetyltransferase
MPSIPHLIEPLSDGRVRVRDAADRDIPEILIAYQDDPDLHVRLGEERPPSGAELGRLADAERDERAAGVRAALTILTGSDDVCRGQIYVHQIGWEDRRADLGMWVALEHRGRGLAGAALRLVAPWLLRHAGLLRLQMLTEPDNEPMLRAAQAAGFVYEGVLRGYRLERGRRVDCAILSLLPSDLEP